MQMNPKTRRHTEGCIPILENTSSTRLLFLSGSIRGGRGAFFEYWEAQRPPGQLGTERDSNPGPKWRCNMEPAQEARPSSYCTSAKVENIWGRTPPC